MRRIRLAVPTSALLVLIATLFAAGTRLKAEDKPKAASTGDEFRANILDMNAPAGQMTATAWIKINNYTSDADVHSYLKLLTEKGQMAVFNVTSKLDIGYFRINGSLGYPIAVARSRATDSGRTVLILLNKPMQGITMAQGVQAADYPFSIIELKLDQKGKGEGQIIGAAQISITKDNKLDIAGSGAIPTRLLDVTKK